MLKNIRGLVSMSDVLLDHRVDLRIDFNIIVCKLIADFMKRIANRKNGPLKVIYDSNYFIYSNMFTCLSNLVF